MKEKSQYRSKHAQDIHTYLIGYVCDRNDINSFQEACEQQDEDILETSINGHSILIDILHLPHAILNEEKNTNAEELQTQKPQHCLNVYGREYLAIMN